jgi:predicted amidohydrolase
MNVAAAQLQAVPGDVAANVAAHVRLIGEAAAAGARIVVFPELSLTGYELDRLRDDDALWLTTGDDRLAPLRDACRAQRIHAVVGAPLRDDGRRILAALAIDDGGEVAVVYAKIHLDEQESELFSPGDEHVVYEVDGRRLGLAVCADASMPGHAARLAALGAEAYLVGALFPAGRMERLLDQMTSRSRENGMYVALGSAVGRGGHYTGIGGSGVWGPDGRAVVQLRDEPSGIAVTELA